MTISVRTAEVADMDRCIELLLALKKAPADTSVHDERAIFKRLLSQELLPRRQVGPDEMHHGICPVVVEDAPE